MANPWNVVVSGTSAQAGPAPGVRGVASGVAGFAKARFQWQALPLFAVRVIVLAAAAAAVTWDVVGTWGVIAAILGTVIGATAGHVLALSRARLGVLVAAAAGVALAGALIGSLAVGSAALVRMLGPSLALDVSAVARFGGYAAAASGLLRMLAVRVPSLVGAELILMVAAVVVPLSPHRHGVVGRPLWLSDWAWHNGYDPAHVLLAIGGIVAFVAGGLLMARTGNRVSLLSWLGLAALVLLGLTVVDVDGLPKPESGSDLGLTGDERGDPPLPTPPGPWEGPGRSNSDKSGGQGEGGGTPDESDDGQGGQGEGGKSDGGQPENGDAGEGGEGGQSGDQDGQSGDQSGKGKQGQDGKQGKDGQGGQSGKKDGKDGGGKPPPTEPNFDDQQGSGAPAPMAIVLLGDDYTPPAGGFYFRQDIWSHFNGSRLVSSRRPDVDRDILKTFPSTKRDVADPPGEQGRQPVTAKVFLTVKHKRPFALESVVSMGPHRNPDAQRFVRAFTFDSLAQSASYEELIGRKHGNPEWPDDVVEYYTVTPDDDRYSELADRIVSELPVAMQKDPFAQALAIKLWLDDNITYSTSERHAGAKDPAADFLFGSQIGYCVHIAHAAAYLWRSRGITARVGTGYRASLDNLKGSALVIRGSDAHAWPELYLEGVGWVVLDISPKKTLDKPSEPADDELTEKLAEIARSKGDEKADSGNKTRTDSSNRQALRWALPLLALLTLCGLYLNKLWRRLAPLWTRGRRLPRVAYRRATDQLGEAGLVRDYGETRMAFAARVATVVPSLSRLAALAEAARLGNPNTPARPELQHGPWRDALAAVSADLRTNVPTKRRIAGLLNPIVPWQVR